MSDSSCVHHKLDRLDMGADIAFCHGLRLFAFLVVTQTLVQHWLVVLTDHPCLYQCEGYCSSLLEQMCCWLPRFHFQHHGSVGFVPLDRLHGRHPRQCILGLHLAGCVQCKAERPTVHNQVKFMHQQSSINNFDINTGNNIWLRYQGLQASHQV